MSHLLDALFGQAGCAPLPAHHPHWAWSIERPVFGSPRGPVRQTWHVLRDGHHIVGCFRAEEQSWDLAAVLPGTGPAALPAVPRYHNPTLMGLRAHIWYDEAPRPDDVRTVTTRVVAERAICEIHIERADGSGRHHCAISMGFDPLVGYRCDLRFTDQRKQPGGTRELLNLMARGLMDPWPDQAHHEYTALTLPQRTVAWALNPAALEWSNRLEPERRCADDGWLAWYGRDREWGWCLGWEGTGHHYATCDAWADHHAMVALATAPAADGWFRSSVRYRMHGLPPAANRRCCAHLPLEAWNGARIHTLRVGAADALAHRTVAVTRPDRGQWQKPGRSPWHIAAGQLEVDAVDAERPEQGIIGTPQIPLAAGTTYRFSAEVQTDPGVRAAGIVARSYEWSPFSGRWSEQQRDVAPSHGQAWRPCCITFSTPPDWDPQLDLRFLALGRGRARFRAISLVAIPSAPDRRRA